MQRFLQGLSGRLQRLRICRVEAETRVLIFEEGGQRIKYDPLVPLFLGQEREDERFAGRRRKRPWRSEANFLLPPGRLHRGAGVGSGSHGDRGETVPWRLRADERGSGWRGEPRRRV